MYEFTYNDKTLQIDTVDSMFSPRGADFGTVLMLEHTIFDVEDKLLDLGCGSGIVSLCAASAGVLPTNITLTDVDPISVECARHNLVNNGFTGANLVCGDALRAVSDTDYTLIMSNPPYHTDFSVAKAFIEEGFKHMVIGGRMLLVTKRKDWYRNKMISVFGGVKIIEQDGYFVFESVKKQARFAGTKPLRHRRK